MIIENIKQKLLKISFINYMTKTITLLNQYIFMLIIQRENGHISNGLKKR